MKRNGNLYQKVASIDNLIEAERKARKGKKDQYGVKLFERDKERLFQELRSLLLEKRFKTSVYKTFKIWEPKERIIFRLPYYPDRIVHHAIMNVVEEIFVSNFTADTYSCIKGRGIHGALKSVQKALLDIDGTQYCLKLDIRKFYPSIDHDILKKKLRRKFKDEDFLWLLDEIIDSTEGVPIGNYLSQFFANFYLSGLDHWLKEVKKVKYYFRYADDIVILSGSKEELHELLSEIRDYLSDELKLELKPNYQVFPVCSRGIDFVGYVIYHTHVLLRKSIKKRFARKVSIGIRDGSWGSYEGWTRHCNSKHLMKKLTNERFQTARNKDRMRRTRRKQNRNAGSIRQRDCSSRL